MTKSTFSNMTPEERIQELAKRQLVREQQKARYAAWKLENALAKAKSEETALDQIASQLGVSGPSYNEEQVARATARIQLAQHRAEEATRLAERKADEAKRLVERFTDLFPHAPLPTTY